MNNDHEVKTILVCTVGGSHQPILKAIENTAPDHVCFICTGRDPETGRPGSRVQIEGKGSVISEKPGAPPSLPNIPTQAGLRDDSHEVREVSADDLDGAFASIREAVESLRQRFPDARVVADYTGGTKTMTAALVIAVLESDGIDLQLVTGARANLHKVADQTEYAVSANIDRIRLQRVMQPFVEAWKRYAYDEAEEGLANLQAPAQQDLRAELNLARSLSRGFAAWDRFDHAAALDALEPYRNRIGKELGLQLKALEMLNEQQGGRREALQLYDLWLNAERRAAQGRYDDAVARLYRLLEWTAQWQLRTRCDIETADIPRDRIPEGVEISPGRDGKYQAGLFQAWQLLEKLDDGPGADFFREHRNEMLDILKSRNLSILAHGFAPVGKIEWEKVETWARKSFLPLLELLAKDAGVRFEIRKLQLPRAVPGNKPVRET